MVSGVSASRYTMTRLKDEMTRKQRKAVIKKISDWADENDVVISMWGDNKTRSDYAAAIVGVVLEPKPSVIYDYDALIRELRVMNAWSEEDAVEWYDFNMARSLPYMPNPPTMITGINNV